MSQLPQNPFDATDALPRTAQLFAEAYSMAHIGADTITEQMNKLENGRDLDRDLCAKALGQLNIAVCKLRSLDHLLGGNPEPKNGY